MKTYNWSFKIKPFYSIFYEKIRGWLLYMNWRKIEQKNLFIEKGAHMSFGSGEYKIRCSKGIIWLTWPWSDDVILNSGEEISFRTEGILCMKAFTGAIVNIKKQNCIKSIPKLLITGTIKAVFSGLKNSGNHSVFGDSVHSITR